jgi:hypothetical protein
MAHHRRREGILRRHPVGIGRQCPSVREKGLLAFIPDGRYVVKSFATDNERNNVCAYGVFSGTHTGQGGPAHRPARA